MNFFMIPSYFRIEILAILTYTIVHAMQQRVNNQVPELVSEKLFFFFLLQKLCINKSLAYRRSVGQIWLLLLRAIEPLLECIICLHHLPYITRMHHLLTSLECIICLHHSNA